MKKVFLCFALVCIVVLSPVACTAFSFSSSNTPEMILEVAKRFGYAELRNGPTIVGRIDGQKYEISFYGCTGALKCTSVQFFASWSTDKDIDLSEINEWNRMNGTGRASLHPNGSPTLRMDLPLPPPVEISSYLNEWFTWWQRGINSFKKHLDLK